MVLAWLTKGYVSSNLQETRTNASETNQLAKLFLTFLQSINTSKLPYIQCGGITLRCEPPRPIPQTTLPITTNTIPTGPPGQQKALFRVPTVVRGRVGGGGKVGAPAMMTIPKQPAREGRGRRERQVSSPTFKMPI